VLDASLFQSASCAVLARARRAIRRGRPAERARVFQREHSPSCERGNHCACWRSDVAGVVAEWVVLLEEPRGWAWSLPSLVHDDLGIRWPACLPSEQLLGEDLEGACSDGVYGVLAFGPS